MLPEKIYKRPPGRLGPLAGLLTDFAVCLATLIIPFVSFSQPNITRVEWYVDTDPGYGNATSITISAGPDLSNLNFSINLAPLSEGVHIACVRSRDVNGAWSHDNKWLFVKPYSINSGTPVPNINRVEWFVDNDPGYGKATAISISPGSDLNNLGFTVDFSALTEGVHIVGVRSRDINGTWSHDNKWLFVKPYSFNSTQTPNITRVEWYLDTDPGYGNATQITATPATVLSGLSFSQSLGGLSAGVHTIGVRSLDGKGAWSHDNKWLFIKPYAGQPARQISQIEYYVDTDPGYGNGVQVQLVAATSLPAKEIIANISGLNAGKHYIFFRSRDNQKAWSFDYLDSFNLASPVAAPQVNINSVAKKFMCVKDSFNVGYDLTGTFVNGNQFSVFLSNAAGDFASETQIGNVVANTDGYVRCYLPPNLPDGNGYMIRIKSSNPALVSAATPFALSFFDRPFFANDTTVFAVCGTDLFNLNSIYPSTSYTLNWNTLNPNAADTGTYHLIAINTNGCSDTVNVSVALEVARWTGAVSSSWHNAGNWNINKVPTEKTHVIIEANKPNNCIISEADAVAASVQVKPGAILNATNNKAVTIAAACNALPN